jgi:hypothetical protein
MALAEGPLVHWFTRGSSSANPGAQPIQKSSEFSCVAATRGSAQARERSTSQERIALSVDKPIVGSPTDMRFEEWLDCRFMNRLQRLSVWRRLDSGIFITLDIGLHLLPSVLDVDGIQEVAHAKGCTQGRVQEPILR